MHAKQGIHRFPLPRIGWAPFFASGLLLLLLLHLSFARGGGGGGE
jgi:hypothetical protein